MGGNDDRKLGAFVGDSFHKGQDPSEHTRLGDHAHVPAWFGAAGGLLGGNEVALLAWDDHAFVVDVGPFGPHARPGMKSACAVMRGAAEPEARRVPTCERVLNIAHECARALRRVHDASTPVAGGDHDLFGLDALEYRGEEIAFELELR